MGVGRYACNGVVDINQLEKMAGNDDCTCIILEGVMSFSEALILKRPVHIMGRGCTVIAKNQINALEIRSKGCTVEGISFRGPSARGEAAGKGNGILLHDVLECAITSCRFVGFGNAGISIDESVGAHQGNLIRGCFFEDNKFGIRINERAEYVQVSNCSLFHNETALYIQGGNANISSCIISDNDIGIHIDHGANHAHGILNGCSINHNRVPLMSTNVTLGFIVSSCAFYYGTVSITKSRFIKFFGCDLANVEVNVRDSSDCYAWNCHLIEMHQQTSEESQAPATGGGGLVLRNCFGDS